MARPCVWLCLAVAGCATSSRDRGWLDGELSDRLGAATSGGEDAPYPPGVGFSDGLDENEVVAVALWRSPSFRAEVTRIDTARATLDEASRPTNPQLSLMGPFGPATAIATLLVPLESLWQLPARTEAAARDADVAGETVLMSALTLARDVRVLHVEVGLAQDRARLRAELAEISAELARLGEVRARLGDTSALEASVLVADARTSADAADAATSELVMARARLRAQLALEDDVPADLEAVFVRTGDGDALSTTSLLEVARTLRPDVHAAELALGAAGARAGWERGRVLTLAALVEGQWSEPTGPSVRIGGRIELPIFGVNPGGIGRAEAEIVRAGALLEGVVQTVLLDVTLAHTRLTQARRSLAVLESEVLPALDDALGVATSSYESGAETHVVVLDVLRRVTEARLRRAELTAEVRRAGAELERAIGGRIEPDAPEAATP